MNYQAITEDNSQSIFGFVTLANGVSEQLFDEFRENHDYDSWIFEGELMYSEFLDRKFNGLLLCP